MKLISCIHTHARTHGLLIFHIPKKEGRITRRFVTSIGRNVSIDKYAINSILLPSFFSPSLSLLIELPFQCFFMLDQQQHSSSHYLPLWLSWQFVLFSVWRFFAFPLLYWGRINLSLFFAPRLRVFYGRPTIEV